MQTASKSQLKSQILEYLKKIKKDKKSFKEDPEKILKSLRGSIIYYKGPAEPVGEDDWEALK